MAFTLIDGVIANDAFATPAAAGTFTLIDGLAHQQFATPAIPTTQPVDAVLGLTTWTASGGGATTYSLACASGSYSVTGQAAVLKVSHSLICAAGSYTVTGQPAGLKLARTLLLSAGSYSVTGQAATLAYSGGVVPAVPYSLTCSAGSYTVTGQSAGLTVARKLTLATGSYTLAGQVAGLLVARRLTLAAGVYTVTGQAATLTYTTGVGPTARTLICSAGSYLVSGQAATLTYTPKTPALGPVGGGWVDYRKKVKNLEDEEPLLTQTGHLIVPSKEDVSVAIALVHHKKAKYNAAEQQRKDEEELMLMF
jgi:hypothetical protein